MTFSSCKQNEVDGIIIGHTLYENQSLYENQELRELIIQTLNKDAMALLKLSNFNCGGGAGCYDLGVIITQIIYLMGEKEFLTMFEILSEEEVKLIVDLIYVGLEYGDFDNDGVLDKKNIESEFPKLLKFYN
jgi:hypothetical protein